MQRVRGNTRRSCELDIGDHPTVPTVEEKWKDSNGTDKDAAIEAVKAGGKTVRIIT